jgi:hypothetical protein
MNTHPLEVIERLIDVELRRRTYTRDEFKDFIRTLNFELYRLLLEPVDLLDEDWGEKFNKHVQIYYHSLLRLMHTISNYLSVEEQQNIDQLNPAFELPDCYKEIFTCLRKRLATILKNPMKNLDIDYLIPTFYFEIDEDSVKADLRLIRDKLSDAGIDPEYWAIFRQTFSVLFSANGNNKISYRQFSYLTELHKKLTNLFSYNRDISHERLQSHLIKQNFNDTRYVKYIKSLIKKETDAIPGIIERLKRLYYWDNEVDQSFDQTLSSYQPSQPSLQKQLSDWINEKITLLKAIKEPQSLADLDPETAEVIRLASSMKMSARQLNLFLAIVLNKDFYNQNKEKVDYLFATFCITVPEDNPLANKILSVLKVVTKVNKVKSRLWN